MAKSSTGNDKTRSSKKKPAAPDALVKGGKAGKPELSEEDLDEVSGGLNPQPLPPIPPVTIKY